MALIKNANSDRLLRSAMVLDMGDVDRQAQRVIDQAQGEAERIMSEARAEASRLTEAASVRGYAEGLERGRHEGRAAGEAAGRDEARASLHTQLLATLERWNAALSDWESQRQAMLHDAEEGVIRFAFEVSKKVVHRQLKIDGMIIRDQLAEALELVGQSTAIEVVVHPDDATIVSEHLPGILEALGRAKHAAIREDDSIAPGGCIVITPAGKIDATIDTKLARIAQALVPNPDPTDGSV